jgi:hypothetical protein
MGLDSIEIVMLWEESLGVEIAAAEGSKLLTPRMAIDLLAVKLGADPDLRGGCLTLRAFNRIRRAMASAAGAPRHEIRPDARFRDLLPRRERDATWKAVRKASGISSLPSLSWGVVVSFAPVTVGELAHWVVAHAARSLKSPNEPWTHSEIRTVVRRGVTEICGARDFSDDDQFVRDIGVN